MESEDGEDHSKGVSGKLSLAQDAEVEAVAQQGVVQQQGGGDGRVYRPQHGDKQRRDDLGPRHQLPDAHLQAQAGGGAFVINVFRSNQGSTLSTA